MKILYIFVYLIFIKSYIDTSLTTQFSTQCVENSKYQIATHCVAI